MAMPTAAQSFPPTASPTSRRVNPEYRLAAHIASGRDNRGHVSTLNNEVS